MIVDDEFLVRLGLKTTIDWNSFGYTIVAEAANGKEALKLFDTANPSIIITDIKMPIMDGLELIEEIKKTKKKVQFIIISNYEDFSYAKQAIKLGVSQYLLKSEINPETIALLLQNNDANTLFEVEELDENNVLRERYLRNTLYKASINSCLPIDQISIPEKEAFDKPPYTIIKYFCNISMLNEASWDMLSKTFLSLLKNTFPDVALYEVIFQKNYYVNIIISLDNVDNNVIEQVLISQSIALNRNLKHYFDVELMGGISSSGDIEDIPKQFIEAELARQYCFFSEENFLLYNRNTMDGNTNKLIPRVSYSTMLDLLSSNDMTRIQTYVSNIFHQLRDLKSFSCLQTLFIDFMGIAKSFYDKMDIKNTVILETHKFDFENLYLLPSIDSIEEYIIDIFNIIVSINNGVMNKYSIHIKKCISYIEKNYYLNITLDDAAEDVNISKSYLSMLFKQETGVNFINYLNNYRIENAKKLLTTTDYKIYEIAEKVGIFSPYYFSKLFKEQTKMGCKEYKDKYSNC